MTMGRHIGYPGVLLALALLGCSAVEAGPLRDWLSDRHSSQAGSVQRLSDQAYGSSTAETLDLYRPANARQAPVVVMVHGGGWRRGDKENHRVVDNKVARWSARGLVLVSVNYPMLPEADPLQQADSVARALAYVQRHAGEWGGDGSKVVLMGHSAGAHLATLLNADPDRVRAVGGRPWLGTVALDSAAYDVPALMGQRHLGLYDRAFGSDRAFWKSASPLHMLTPKAYPMLAVCSTVRPDRPCAQADAFRQQATALGVRVTVQREALSHGEINQALGLDSDYTRSVEQFMAGLDPALASRLEHQPGN